MYVRKPTVTQEEAKTRAPNKVDRNQGDQIGRIFAQWANVYFGQYFEKHKSDPNFWATFSEDEVKYKF
jgi:hypothetical protein